MSEPLQYPFSDLTHEQIRLLIRAAHLARAQAIRGVFAALFQRQREAQAWPPAALPALSLSLHR